MKATTHTLWTFVVTPVAAIHGRTRQPRRLNRDPGDSRRPRCLTRALEWTVNAFHPRVRGLPAHRGRARRPLRAQADVHARGRHLHRRVRGRCAGASADWLIAARAVQGLGAAIVTPLTLTILSDAVSRERRGAALGAWSGIAGLAVAMGPLVGGAVVDGIAWQWIFWLNVPVGLVLLPLATQLRESHGPDKALDLPGLVLASAGMLGLVWGVIHGTVTAGRARGIVGALAGGAALLGAVRCLGASRARADAADALLPQPRLRSSERRILLMYFGMFGSIFLLVQFFQTAQGYSPLKAGLLLPPWTAMELVVAPIAGALSDRDRRPAAARRGARPAGGRARMDGRGLDGNRRLRVARRAVHRLRDRDGDVLRAGRERRPLGRAAGGGGEVLRCKQRDPRSRRRARRCRAGLDLRPHGGYETPEAFTDGLVRALWAGAAVVGVGAALALSSRAGGASRRRPPRNPTSSCRRPRRPERPG